jgi:3-hydroxybutyryl-CoA dehydrogenase
MSAQTPDQNMEPECIAIVGLGLLGRGVAASFLAHGFKVVAVDRSEAQHTAARQHVGMMIDELISFGGCAAELREEWPARYTTTTSFDLLQNCSFVVESVTEDIIIKEEVFNSIESVVGESVVIASNTSAIPISQLQQGRKHPQRFVGMHWAGPAHSTRFMELIRGDQTSEETLQATAAIARQLGKEPCLCQKDVPGFIVNRVGYAMYREAMHMLESGVADAETIDLAVRNAMGLWAAICGPLRWIDVSGGPEAYFKAMNQVFPTLSKADAPPAMMAELVAKGARGIANGRGFYNYTPEEAKHWEELYRRHTWRVAQMQDEYFPLDKEA